MDNINSANNSESLIQNGIILIDKPKGISSFDVIRRLRSEYKSAVAMVPKMGHAGTLDPMATGLLIIGVGKETKRLSEMLKLSKVYEAEIRLGIETDSFDMDGEIVKSEPIEDLKNRLNLNTEKVKETLATFVGEQDLQVPVYSALKRDGKSLYEYAREGKEIEAPIRRMKIYSADFIDFDGMNIKARFKVGSGTYIRSIAQEMGHRLGTVATLSALRRTSIGEYTVEKARTI